MLKKLFNTKLARGTVQLPLLSSFPYDDVRRDNGGGGCNSNKCSRCRSLNDTSPNTLPPQVAFLDEFES